MTGRDPKGRYALIKEIISDPHQPTVLIHVRMEGDPDFLNRLKVYALLAPHLEVGGAGNSARAIDVGGKRVLLAWKDHTSLAMSTDCGFSRTSCGYVGTSDGWTDLNQNFQMNWEFDQALDGNIAVIGEIDVARFPEFTVGVGFGEGRHAALACTIQSLATGFAAHRERFHAQWHRVRCPLQLISSSGDHGHLRISVKVFCWRTKTKHFREPLSLQPPSRGGKRKAMTTWAATTWCGHATWCRRRRL